MEAVSTSRKRSCADAGFVTPALSRHKLKIDTSDNTTPFANEKSMPYGLDSSLDQKLGVCAKEVHAHMRRQEKLWRKYNPEAKYLTYRYVLVEWMYKLGDGFQLKRSTVFIAVAYIDRILQSVTFPRNQLQILATACVWIAAKFDECDIVPNVNDLIAYTRAKYKAKSVLEMECIVLNILQWNLCEYTPLHFLGYYFNQGLVFREDVVDGHRLSRPKDVRLLKKYSKFFADRLMLEYEFQKFVPSLLAVGIILIGRRAMKISPAWKDDFSAMSGHSKRRAINCANILWKHYTENFPLPSQSETPTNIRDILEFGSPVPKSFAWDA